MEIHYDFRQEALNDKIDGIVYEIERIERKIYYLRVQINELPPAETLVDGIYSYQIYDGLVAHIQEYQIVLSELRTELDHLTQ